MITRLQTPLSKDYFTAICKLGQGHACCRYLVGGTAGIECAKHTALKEQIDARVMGQSMVARGDNCDGVIHEYQSAQV